MQLFRFLQMSLVSGIVQASLSASTGIGSGPVQDKSIADTDPIRRLDRLNEFAQIWLDRYFGEAKPSMVSRWGAKFDKNVSRFKRRYEICGEDSQALTGRSLEEFELKIDNDDPSKAIVQITTGFSKFAHRFLNGCKNQPAVQASRAILWNLFLQEHLMELADL